MMDLKDQNIYFIWNDLDLWELVIKKVIFTNNNTKFKQQTLMEKYLLVEEH